MTCTFCRRGPKSLRRINTPSSTALSKETVIDAATVVIAGKGDRTDLHAGTTIGARAAAREANEVALDRRAGEEDPKTEAGDRSGRNPRRLPSS